MVSYTFYCTDFYYIVLELYYVLNITDGDPDRLRYIHGREGHPPELKQVIFTEEKKRNVFKDVHDSSRGVHMGISKTIAKITEKFYWIGINKDVIKWISECDKCQRTEKIKAVATVLKPIKTEGPWQMVGVDLIGPLK